MVDNGKGPPLALVPGIQGRWEYMEPALEALRQKFRVLTFALSGEPGTSVTLDRARGVENDVQEIVAALDRAGVSSAVICGVSYGGLPAIRFAARYPSRARALVLVSTPAPPWQLRPRHRFYAKLPWFFGPLFFVETPFRLRAEVGAAIPAWLARWRFVTGQLQAFLQAPVSPTRMAVRAMWIADTDIVADCANVSAPTLVVTGEPALDRVVSVDGTLSYLKLIENSRHVMLRATGHLGSITHPEAFAAALHDFVSGLPDQAAVDGVSGEKNDAA